MRTLDEVIAMAEHCWQPMPESLCATCPSENKTSKCRLYSDILYYLKEYKKLDSLDVIVFTDDNPPLTWDELKQMEGKPVWIEGPLITGGPHWIIVGPSHLHDGKIVGYGKTWQAYRKERE